MIIERTKDEIIFRLAGEISLDELQNITDFLEFKEISTKSKATQSDVDELVKEIKKGRWGKTKSKLDL